MKNLASFLTPKRKPNLKFRLSRAFVDENGEPIEWEMRQLSAAESAEITGTGEMNYQKAMIKCVSESLVYPDMHDRDLLDGLSKREGRKILDAAEALALLVSDAEMGTLISKYNSLYDETDVGQKITEVKN